MAPRVEAPWSLPAAPGVMLPDPSRPRHLLKVHGLELASEPQFPHLRNGSDTWSPGQVMCSAKQHLLHVSVRDG